MKPKLLFTLIFCLIFSGGIRAQQLIRTYFDTLQTIVKEEFTILGNDSSILDGNYKRYYEDGSLAARAVYQEKDCLKKTPWQENWWCIFRMAN